MTPPDAEQRSSYVVWICPVCKRQGEYMDGRDYHPCGCDTGEANGWRVHPRVPLVVAPLQQEDGA